MSDGWSDFACKNGSEDIAKIAIGTSLWDVIHDESMRHFYRALITELRLNNSSALSFPFRCDSPDTERIMQMIVDLEDDGQISFTSITVEQNALKKKTLHKVQHIEICSRCSNIHTHCGWVDIRGALDGVEILRNIPHFSINLRKCPICKNTA